MNGIGQQVHVTYKNRYGRQRSYYAEYEGVVSFLGAPDGQHRVGLRAREVRGLHARGVLPGLRRDPAAPGDPGGHPARWTPKVTARSAVEVSISDVSAMSIGDAEKFFPRLILGERDRMIAEPVLKEVAARLGFLLDVGLEYLSLDRPAATLSGGEAQRIRLATQIGSGLVGVLYVLDEPSIGLHQRDNHRLIQTLSRLRDLGNTLIVVEHDEDTIRTADWVVDIGPGAGEHGGRVVVSGSRAGPGVVAGVDHRRLPRGPQGDPGAAGPPAAWTRTGC